MASPRSTKKGPDKMSRPKCILLLLFMLIVFMLIINFYFVSIINNKLSPTDFEKTVSTSPKSLPSSSLSSQKIILLDASEIKNNGNVRPVHKNASVTFANKINNVISNLPANYLMPSPFVKREVTKLWNCLQPSVGTSIQLWSVVKEWVGARHVVPTLSPLLGSILKTISVAKIIKAQNAPGGTQLKLLITLQGGQQALFKPQWYKRNDYIEGPVYSGKDRHNAEVAAFHLALLLGLRRVPLTAGRTLDLLKEIVPVASKSLLKTFITDGKNNTCFYGNCHYCSRSDAVCGKKSLMEGAIILMLPQNIKLKPYRSPWQRTYKESKAAKWELDYNYCKSIKANNIYSLKNGPRLLDLIDAALFDFLIDNGDRHHYEVPVNISGAAVMLIDNGKSFGHPLQDHLDILAPLYQCCLLRQTTWERLLLFTGDTLGKSLEKLLTPNLISPVLSQEHFSALNRRLRSIFATAELCFLNYGKKQVLIDDGYR